MIPLALIALVIDFGVAFGLAALGVPLWGVVLFVLAAAVFWVGLSYSLRARASSVRDRTKSAP